MPRKRTAGDQGEAKLSTEEIDAALDAAAKEHPSRSRGLGCGTCRLANVETLNAVYARARERGDLTLENTHKYLLKGKFSYPFSHEAWRKHERGCLNERAQD
jgi:hypothetical protein